jgi:hypothetical protein
MVDDWIYHNKPAEDKLNSSQYPRYIAMERQKVLPSGNLT